MRVERSQQVRREPDRHPRRHTNIQRTLSHVRHNTSQKYNNPAPGDATQAGEEDSARLLRAEGTQPRTMVRHARVRVKWLFDVRTGCKRRLATLFCASDVLSHVSDAWCWEEMREGQT